MARVVRKESLIKQIIMSQISDLEVLKL